MTRWWTSATALLVLTVAAACQEPQALSPDLLATGATRLARTQRARDLELEVCRKAIAEVQRRDSLDGAPEFEKNRVPILGRARGAPVIFLREPRRTPHDQLPPKLHATARALEKLPPKTRVRKTLARHRRDYESLRALLLREGYVYATEPAEALALVKVLELPRLFGETEIWLHRGATRHRLARTSGRVVEYRHADGPLKGQPAVLLFADRVAVSRDALSAPLHRDLRPLSWSTGFDRTRVLHRTPEAVVAELRFGELWVKTLLRSRDAAFEIQCIDGPQKLRQRVTAWQQKTAPRRRALAELRRAVDQSLAERLPFDRPRGAEDHLTDGQLRPQWWSAYRRGRAGFSHDDHGYLVFDQRGRPTPPQMCVDFVLDSFERGAGTWFRPRGDRPEREIGGLDFTALGLKNRAGVLAFGKFAAAHPKRFDHRELPAAERIPFGNRKEFFAYLLEHADEFRPGDVVAIQGLKRDGNIHQHAILMEDTDPVTGFPYGLADQMKWPRRRTWEGIMAEAPKRALLFHVRLKDELLLQLDPEHRGG